MVFTSGRKLLIFTAYQSYLMYTLVKIVFRSLNRSVAKMWSSVMNRTTFLKVSLCLLLFASLHFRSREWLCIKEFPQCWPKLHFLSPPPSETQCISGLRGQRSPRSLSCWWSCTAPMSSGHAFFLGIPLRLFHAYHHVCSWRYCLLLHPNLSQGWYYSLSFSSRFSCSSLHPFTALRRGGARIKQFFFHVSRI